VVDYRIPSFNLSLEYGYEDLSSCFKEASFGKIDFEKQYASDYFIRLETSREAMINVARARWVSSETITEEQIVGHVKSYKSNDKDIVLFGVLFKDMCLKPNVLNDIQNNLNLSDQFMIPQSCSDITNKLSTTDTVYIEDMEARLQLSFDDNNMIDSLVTGTVVAVLGKVNHMGFFEVKDLCLAGYPGPSTMLPTDKPPVYIAFVSGLQIGSPKANPMALTLLRDFVMGNSGVESQRILASKIARLVVAGDTLYYNQARDPTASSIAEADVYMTELASVISVDIMSGPRDPANYCLPQEPLHSGLFPQARRYANLTVHTNPYKFKMGDMVILGTSGQNVNDVMQYSSRDGPLDSLDLIVQSRYLAPTAPDTLACYPFTTVDPLIISESNGGFPHVVFAGNQVSIGTRRIADGKALIASVSDFSVKPSLLLININNIDDVRTISFDVPTLSD